MEMSRQRIRPSLGESASRVCPRCHGQGTIRDNESLALAILRLIEEEGLKENTVQIQATVPVAVAAYLLNEKRKAVAKIEHRHNCEVYIIPNANLLTPHFEIKRTRKDGKEDINYDALEKQHSVYVPNLIQSEHDKESEPALSGFFQPQKSAAASKTGDKKTGTKGGRKRRATTFSFSPYRQTYQLSICDTGTAREPNGKRAATNSTANATTTPTSKQQKTQYSRQKLAYRKRDFGNKSD